MLEIEKTYLPKYLPKGLAKCRHEEIIDIYVPKSAFHPIIRIRKKGATFEITKKEPPNEDDVSHQHEQTITLTAAEFAALSKVEGKRVRKIRYYYDYNGRTAEIGIFQDELQGLGFAIFSFPRAFDSDTMKKLKNESAESEVKTVIPIISRVLASLRLRDESFLYRTILRYVIEEPYTSRSAAEDGRVALSKLAYKCSSHIREATFTKKQEYERLSQGHKNNLEDYLTILTGKTETFVYEHVNDENIEYVKYKDRRALVNYNFYADMGFSGWSINPIGYVIGKSKTLDKKSGKQITLVQKLLNEEREELKKNLYLRMRSTS
jgi:CYTH domain-containing protein